MTRRACLLTPLALRALRGGAADEVYELVADLAAALAEDNADAFLSRLAPEFDDRQTVELNIRALVQQNEVLSAITPLTQSGDDQKRTATVDWYLEIKNRADSHITRRRENVTLHVQRHGKKWRVHHLEPGAHFTPPAATP